jgi:hypothetical protein
MVAKQQQKKRIKCFNCGKTGHMKRKCHAPEGGAVGNAQGDKTKGNGRNTGNSTAKANDAVDQDFGFVAIELIEAVPKNDATIDRALVAADESWLWFRDLGTTTHVANAREYFTQYRALLGGLTISGVGGTSTIVGRGSVKVRTRGGGSLVLHNVAHVPSVPHNLISLTRADDAGCKFVGGNSKLIVYSLQGNVLMQGHKPKGPGQLYRMYIAAEPTERANIAILGKRTWEQFHKIMGHVNVATLKWLKIGPEYRISIDPTSEDDFQCKTCIRAKQHVEPFPDQATRTPDKLKAGKIVVCDVWGSAQVRSVHGYQYSMTFTDLAVQFSGVYFSATKSNWAVSALTEFANLIWRMSKTGSSIMCLRIDNETEFINKEFISYCKSLGIVIETTAPHSPAQNSVAKRLNCTHVESARAMLLAQDISKRFWPEAVSYAVYIKNCVPHAALNWMTPYEALTGTPLDLSPFYEFGSKCWVLDQSGHRGKLDAKSRPCIFLGIAKNSKAFWLWDPEKRTFVKSRNVTFEAYKPDIEVILPSSGELSKEESKRQGSRTVESPKAVADPKQEPLSARISTSTESAAGVPDEKPAGSEALRSDSPALRARSSRLAAKPIVDYKRLYNPQACGTKQSKAGSTEPPAEFPADAHESASTEEIAEWAYTSAEAEDDPQSYQDAISRPNANQWHDAMQHEYDQLIQMGTWELVELPKERSLVSCKWVYRLKRDSKGNIVKYKARLVAQGFSQKPGIDYTETYAPVMRTDLLQMLTAIATELDLEMHAMDVMGAYLNGKLEVDVYMRQPIGFDDGSGRVCKLILALYGLI